MSGGVSLFEGKHFLLDGESRVVIAPGIADLDDGERVVHLARPDGTVEVVAVKDLGRRRKVTEALRLGPDREPVPPNGRDKADRTVFDLIAPDKQEATNQALAHVLEALTGFQSGDESKPLTGEPRKEYDPATVPLMLRYQNKADEMKAICERIGPKASKRAGIDKLSKGSIMRKAGVWKQTHSVGALVDRRHVRPKTGPRVREDLAEHLWDVVSEVERHFQGKSRVTVETRHLQLCLEARRTGFPLDQLPGYDAYRKLRNAWFDGDGARMKYQRSGSTLPNQMVSVKASRPGEQVMLDTSPFNVMVKDGLWGDPVMAILTLAVDVCSRAIVGWTFTLTSDKAVDVAMVLRNVMTPLYMREGWNSDAEWHYPGVPANLFVPDGRYLLAGKPFFEIETAIVDHGSVYVNHHLIDLCQRFGINILPARKARGRDKGVVEKMFDVIRALLQERLPGWRGVDVADRGADPESDAVLTLDELDEYLAWFVTGVWHERKLGEYRPWYAPAGNHSPNSLFAVSMAQTGWSLRWPHPDDYYELLETMTPRIGRRGVSVKGLWYRDASDPRGMGVLSDPLAQHGSVRLPDRRDRKAVVKYDPRDRRQVYCQHPTTNEWHELRWEGLPPEGEFPAFSDVTAQAVLAVAADQRMKPKHQRELLHLFYERAITAGDTKDSRRQSAREAAQARAAAADKARGDAPVNQRPTAPPTLVVVNDQPTTDSPTTETIGRAVDEARHTTRTEDDEDDGWTPTAAKPITARRRVAPTRDQEESA